MVLSARIPTVWRQAVKRASWDTYQRVFRSSALELADAADVDGLICKSRESLAERVGLPLRSFDYHLSWLIERGWIQREQRAVNRGDSRRPAVYRLRIPEDLESQRIANGTPVSNRNPQRMETPLSNRNMVANVNRDSASISEHLALREDAADETTTAALASDAQPSTQVQPGNGEEAPEPPAAFVAGSPREREDDITRAARVLEVHGLLHRDHGRRLVSDVAVGS